MRNIILIGAGSIGSWHLQALAKSKSNLEIQVVDRRKAALETAKKFLKIEDNDGKKNIRYYTNLNRIASKADLAIIATSSNTRKDVIRDLLNTTEVPYLIVEKILFQNLEDFDEIESLLDERNVKAWVNCPRRLMPVYQEMKRALNNERIYYTVQGGDWGLASNAIHFIDLLAFFTGETEIKIDVNSLDDRIRESKRKGFVEFTGKLYCRTEKGSELSLLSISDSTAPILITILSNSLFYVIDEGSQKVRVAKKNNAWRWEEVNFKFYYQSELTHLALKNILETGNCLLTSLNESALLHKHMLGGFIRHIEKVSNKKWRFCPIT